MFSKIGARIARSIGIRKIPMRENQARVVRSRGRPQLRSDEETLRLVVEAASGEFQTRGYKDMVT